MLFTNKSTAVKQTIAQHLGSGFEFFESITNENRFSGSDNDKEMIVLTAQGRQLYQIVH